MQANPANPQPVLVECPKCKQPGFVDAWPRITSTVDTQAMELLEAGKLFEYACPVCSTKVAMAYDCLLHDVEHKALLLYSTDKNALQTGPRRLIVERDKLHSNGVDIDDYQLRVALTTFEFCEKVRIWNDGYDDRAIELMKVAIKRGMLKEGIIGARDTLIYERTIPETRGVSFIVVGEIPGDTVGVPQGYDYCKRFLDEAELEGKLVGEYRFGAAWANEFLP